MFRDFADNEDAAVNDNELTLFLANSTSLINARISTLYALPILETSQPLSFSILKQWQMYSVASIVDDILNNYSSAEQKPKWSQRAKELSMQLVPELNPALHRQLEPVLKLPDAKYLGTTTQRSPIKISKTSGTIFKKGKESW